MCVCVYVYAYVWMFGFAGVGLVRFRCLHSVLSNAERFSLHAQKQGSRNVSDYLHSSCMRKG